MTHLYDTEEPNVISQELLRKSVLSQGPEGEAGRLAKEQEIEFSAVRRLRLDFQNILRIENLWQFSGLRKLQLDNNIIEKIDGLGTLVHLEWLDLSFNNIAEVGPGLQALVNLRDLSLAHNQLTDISGFQNLCQLQSLSLASNKLDTLEQVTRLRPLSSLQSLSLSGNPLASETDYQHHCIAFIPSLIYLDFAMVFPEEREAACAVFSEELAELELSEREAARKREERDAAQQLEETYRVAYVDGLQGTAMFEALLSEDSDAERIALLPNVAHMLKELKEELVKCCDHLTKVGLEEKKKRDEELASFHRSHHQACSLSQQRSVDIVAGYEDCKRKLASGDRSELVAALSSVEHALMKEEMTLMEQLEDIMKDFERTYSDMVGSFLEGVQSHMTQLRELENGHHEKVTEIGLQYLESTIKGTLEEEPPDNLRKLLTDKDTLVSALNTSHDSHLLAIDAREDSIAHRSKSDLSSLLEGLGEEELARNRRKVTEIRQYIDWEKQEVETV